jgi:RimJ/RimL family protein N-acetyltransferase
MTTDPTARGTSDTDGAGQTKPFDRISWPVRTERLVLRPATNEDLPAVWQFRRLDEVAQWMTRAPKSEQEFRETFAGGDRLQTTLVIELDGDVVGDLMLAVENPWAQAEVSELARGTQAELGWCLHPDHGGRGYATEAVEALLRLSFDDLGLRRVTANCFADNTASWRLMERLGMRREIHTVRESLHRDLGWLDGMGYALLADEWRERVAG